MRFGNEAAGGRWLAAALIYAFMGFEFQRFGLYPAQVMELEVGYGTGADRLLLWLPVLVTHRITEDSPLASWANMSGFLADADSFIAVTVRTGTVFI